MGLTKTVQEAADELLPSPDEYSGPMPECPNCTRYLEVLDDALDTLTVQRPEIGKMLPALVQTITEALEGYQGIAGRRFELGRPKPKATLGMPGQREATLGQPGTGTTIS